MTESAQTALPPRITSETSGIDYAVIAKADKLLFLPSAAWDDHLIVVVVKQIQKVRQSV
jgi:hypothetical protein